VIESSGKSMRHPSEGISQGEAKWRRLERGGGARKSIRLISGPRLAEMMRSQSIVLWNGFAVGKSIPKDIHY
jgi:hypothetical protein